MKSWDPGWKHSFTFRLLSYTKRYQRCLEDIHLSTESLDISIPDKGWVKEVTKNVPSSSRAFAIISRACAATELEPNYVLYQVFWYCKSAEEHSISLRRNRAGGAKRRAQEALSSCKKFWKAIQQSGYADIAAKTPNSLRAVLDSFAQYLQSVISDFKQIETRKSSGPNDRLLMFLVEELKAHTGKPHLGDIATLVRSGLSALDVDCKMIADRRDFVDRIQRFKKRFPHEAEFISLLASEAKVRRTGPRFLIFDLPPFQSACPTFKEARSEKHRDFEGRINARENLRTKTTNHGRRTAHR